jgi:hypothetical protein
MDASMITNEQATVAAILMDSRVLRFAVKEVVPQDFEDSGLGRIYAGMTAMAADKEPIDAITVGAQLAAWGVRGVAPADLWTWMTEVTVATNVSAYASKVRQGALRRGVSAIATRMVQTAEADPTVALARAVDDVRALREDHVVSGFQSSTLGEVLEGTDDYDWVIEGLLERGDRLMLTGTEGGGKSTLVRQLAIMSAAGIHPMTFHQMKPARVLVVDAENSEKQWRRASKAMVGKAALWGSLNPAEVVQLACVPRIDLTKDADLSEVHRLIDEHQPDVLFIGPLYRLVPRAINDDDSATPLLAALDTLRQRGTALVIEAHAGVGSAQNRGERDLRPRGSAALMGWPEFGLGLRPDKGGRSSKDFELIRWRGDRDERAWPTRISRGISDWPWTPTVRF